jgi:hypothetical protein
MAAPARAPAPRDDEKTQKRKQELEEVFRLFDADQ